MKKQCGLLGCLIYETVCRHVENHSCHPGSLDAARVESLRSDRVTNKADQSPSLDRITSRLGHGKTIPRRIFTSLTSVGLLDGSR